MTWGELQKKVEGEGVSDETVLLKVAWPGGTAPVQVVAAPYQHPAPHHIRQRPRVVEAPAEAVEPPVEAVDLAPHEEEPAPQPTHNIPT